MSEVTKLDFSGGELGGGFAGVDEAVEFVFIRVEILDEGTGERAEGVVAGNQGKDLPGCRTILSQLGGDARAGERGLAPTGCAGDGEKAGPVETDEDFGNSGVTAEVERGVFFAEMGQSFVRADSEGERGKSGGLLAADGGDEVGELEFIRAEIDPRVLVEEAQGGVGAGEAGRE